MFSLFFFHHTCTQSVLRMSDITELDVSKRCKDLGIHGKSFMESLLQETKALGVDKDGLLTADELKSFSVTISYVLVSPRTLLRLIITYALVCYEKKETLAHTCDSNTTYC